MNVLGAWRRGGIDLRQLQYFLVLAEELHFGRAAERLHVAQPAISQAIRRLEAQLEAPLFDRTTRRVELTVAGARLRDDLRRVLADLDESLARVRTTRGGELTIGFSNAFTRGLVPELVRELAGDELHLVLEELELGRVVPRLLARGLDAALLYPDAEPPQDLCFEPIARERLLVAVPACHPLAGAGAAPLERFAAETFIGVPVGTAAGWRAQLRALFARHDIDPPMGPEVASLVSHLWMVQSGQGLTVVPEQAASRPVEGVAFVEAEGERVTVGLCWREDRAPARLDALLAAARRAARTLDLAAPAGDAASA